MRWSTRRDRTPRQTEEVTLRGWKDTHPSSGCTHGSAPSPSTDVKLQLKLQPEFLEEPEQLPLFWNIPGCLGSHQISFLFPQVNSALAYTKPTRVPVFWVQSLRQKRTQDACLPGSSLPQPQCTKQRALLASPQLDCIHMHMCTREMN